MRPAISTLHGPVVAITCSDLHFQHAPPLARSGEPNWYKAMEKPVMELWDIKQATGAPVICAGDVFDKWCCIPELVNWAISVLPVMHAIPGQHDLPNHSLADIRRSAYWTLVEAGVIKELGQTPARLEKNLWVQGFPWGVPVSGERMLAKCPPPPKPAVEDCFTGGKYEHQVKLAVVHAYIWQPGCGYPDAPQDQELTAWTDKLVGFTNAVFGDNHIGFMAIAGDCRVLNHGSFMRRKSDQIHYQPTVGIIYADGYVQKWGLNTDDEIIENMVEPTTGKQIDAEGFIAELLQLGNGLLDYRDAVESYLRAHIVSGSAERILRGYLDGCKRG